MKYLTRKDEMMCLAILRLEDEASLVGLRALLNEHTGRRWSIGNVFVSLDKLESLGYIESQLGEPTGRRGGKAVKFYRLTPVGMEALRETKKMQDGMWTGLHDVVFDDSPI